MQVVGSKAILPQYTYLWILGNYQTRTQNEKLAIDRRAAGLTCHGSPRLVAASADQREMSISQFVRYGVMKRLKADGVRIKRQTKRAPTSQRIPTLVETMCALRATRCKGQAPRV